VRLVEVVYMDHKLSPLDFPHLKHTFFCLIGVGYCLELLLLLIFTDNNIFYHLSHIIFFGVHTNYLCNLG
jgi:hypothetical protein